MYYTIYKITNQINGKFYTGKHQTKDLNDNYWGSGTWLTRAISKYGVENFSKEIIEIYDSEEKMNLAEKILVVCDPDISYNLSPGGKGGFGYINLLGLTKGSNNVMISNIEAKNRCIKNAKITRNNNKKYFDDISRENLKISHQKAIGRKRPEHSKLMKEKEILKNYWNENKEKFRDKLSSWFMLKSPDNQEYKTNRLEDFCKKHNLGYGAIWRSSITNRSPIKGKSKGWICQKI